MPLRAVSLGELVIDDEEALSLVPLYPRLKQVLESSGHRFRIPANRARASWDRVLFLNLTYWSGAEGADVLADEHVPADVVAHVAWHHVVGRQLAAAGSAGAAAMLFSEAVASAFDLYLVGRLLNLAPQSDFIATQVPQMAEAAEEAGLSESGFAGLLEQVSADPEAAFEDLRRLLFDVATALLACRDAEEAQLALERFAAHRFEPLLHHFQLSNWILYARAYGGGETRASDEAVRRLDASLRGASKPLEVAASWIDG
jgi:hypothetical protein